MSKPLVRCVRGDATICKGCPHLEPHEWQDVPHPWDCEEEWCGDIKETVKCERVPEREGD